MIAMRPDWCISRQRVWGVPIIVFYCDACGEPFTDKQVLEQVVDEFRRHSADVWYTKSVFELMEQNVVAASVAATSSEKRRTFWMSGSTRDRATWQFSLRKTGCLGPPICIWKAAINTAAGSIVHC